MIRLASSPSIQQEIFEKRASVSLGIRDPTPIPIPLAGPRTPYPALFLAIFNGLTFGFEIFSTGASFRMLSAKANTYEALFLTGSSGRTFAAAPLSIVAQ